MNKEELNDIKLKFIEILSEWPQLKSFIHSNDFTSIVNKLYELKNNGKRFTPILKNVFKAFELSSFNDTRIVILAKDPHPYIGYANGLALCCENVKKPLAELKLFIDNIYSTVYPELKKPETFNSSIRYLSEQGILLLNTSLTCQIDNHKSHYDIWKPFIDYVIDLLNHKKENLVFILLGEQAQEYEDVIDNEKHCIIKASHPSSVLKTKDNEWDSDDCFNKCNNYLKLNNKQTINWLQNEHK